MSYLIIVVLLFTGSIHGCGSHCKQKLDTQFLLTTVSKNRQPFLLNTPLRRFLKSFSENNNNNNNNKII